MVWSIFGCPHEVKVKYYQEPTQLTSGGDPIAYYDNKNVIRQILNYLT